MKALLEKIRKILRSRRTRQLLTRAVSGVAAIVVFITTYALVLPAITMEQDAFCGIPEHQHTDACYEERLVCEIPESEEHHHDASCYEKFLICGKEVHTHSTECYQKDSSAVVSSGSGAAASTALEAFAEPDVYETGVSEFASGAAVMDSAAGGQSVMEEPADEEAASSQAATQGTDEVDLDSEGLASEAEDLNAEGTDEGEDAPEKPSENNVSETVPDGSDNGGNGLEDTEQTEQEGPAGADDSELAAESGQDLAGTDLETSGSGNSENIDADTTNPEDRENKESEEDKTAVDILEDAGSELTEQVNKEDEDLGLEAGDPMDMNEDSVSGSDTLDNLDTLDTSDGAAEDTDGAETEDTAPAAGTEEAANDATTNILPEPVETENLSSGYVPELDSIEFGTVLNKHTDFFYFHPVECQELPASSAEVTDWKKVKNGFFGSTKLKSTDLVKMYLSYTIPAGALNETNQVARYRLPSNIHLTDDQIIAINATENGMSALYADAAVNEDESMADQGDENIAEDAGDEARAERLESDSKVEDSAEDAGTASGTDEGDGADIEAASDTSEQVQDENAANYQKYLGAEAIEGTRTPDEKLKEGEQEYISAIVKAENVFDEEGLYGEKGAFLGQDLIFIFTPYSIEKNQTIYNADGDPLSAGEKITGWFACDFNMSQIDWVEEDTDLDNSTVEKTAEVVFVEKDSEKNVKEISRKLKLVDTTEEHGDAANGGETAAVAETAVVAETAAAAEIAATAETASETAATDEAALASTWNTSEQAVPEETENGPFKSGTLTADGDGYRITLDYTEEAKIPENAELSVREITAETDKEAYEACLEQAGQQVAADEKTSVDQKASRFFDIEILVKDTEDNDQGETHKIEPAAPVSVNIQVIEDNTSAEDVASTDKEASQSEPAVLHFAEEGVELIDSTVKTSEEQDDNKDRSGSEKTEPATEISFEAESFSIYGVVYTVDFHYEINGKMYDFSIPGGGFVSLEHVVEVLGIATADENGENGAENAENGAENGNDFAGEVPGVDENGENGTVYEEAIKLNEVEVSESTKKFVMDVESVEFSSPELVWVGKVDEATTVGGLKEVKGLEVEYSTELTEEQIAEINVQTVEAGDWALISLQPFTSEETLIATMKNGDQFIVKVTDAQISTHVITADGEDYIITVTYGPEAEIPDGAKLTARELVKGTKEYQQYYEETLQALNLTETNLTETIEENSEEGFVQSTVQARFFDITIYAGEREIEPNAPVSVEIKYQGQAYSACQEVSVVHFAKSGLETIAPVASANGNDTIISFEQESFSVTGTVINQVDISNGEYYIIHQVGENWYALASDGSYVDVTANYDNASSSVVDYDGTKNIVWHVTSTGDNYYTIKAEGEDRYITLNGSVVGNSSGAVSIHSGTSESPKNAWITRDVTQNVYFGFDFYPTSYRYHSTALGWNYGFSINNNSLWLQQDLWGRLHYRGGNEASGTNVQFAKLSTNSGELGGNYPNKTYNIDQLDTWLQQAMTDNPIQETSKTASVYDYDNRIYQIDLSTKSGVLGIASDISLAFVTDVSNSMLFPASLTEVSGKTSIKLNSGNLNSLPHNNGEVYFTIADKNSSSTVFALYYDGGWKALDASYYAKWRGTGVSPDSAHSAVSIGTQNTYLRSDPNSTYYTIYTANDGYISGLDSHNIYDMTQGNMGNRLYYLEQSIADSVSDLKSIAAKYPLGSIHTALETFAGKNASQAVKDRINYLKIGGYSTNMAQANQTYNNNYNTLYNALSDITTADGTMQNVALSDSTFFGSPAGTGGYIGSNNAEQKYVILVTDGAPNGTGANVDSVVAAAKTLRANGVNVITIGLSIEDVTNADRMLYWAASAMDSNGNIVTNPYTPNDLSAVPSANADKRLFYWAKNGEDLTWIMREIVRTVMKEATVSTTIRDEISEVFYPVSEDGTPLNNGDWIKADGTKCSSSDPNRAGKITYANGKYTVEWKDQDATWTGWSGKVYVKAREDFLGGNNITTNDYCSFTPTKYTTNKGTSNEKSAPFSAADQAAKKVETATPCVNVDELHMTANSTDFTVYLGTEVDPATELTKLWNEIKVIEVVKEDGTKSGYTIKTANDMYYPTDGANKASKDEIFPQSGYDAIPLSHYGLNESILTDLLTAIKTSNSATSDPIAYAPYNQGKVGTITVTLTKSVNSEAQGKAPDPHDTEAVSTTSTTPVERYTLTVAYNPLPAEGDNETENRKSILIAAGKVSETDTDYKHNSENGPGNETDESTSNNIHRIFVFAKGLMITKKDESFNHSLSGAEFKLYRTPNDDDPAGVKETVPGLDGQYVYVSDLMDMEEFYRELYEIEEGYEGVFATDYLPLLKDGGQYYLVETKAPAGFIQCEPIPITITISNTYAPVPPGSPYGPNMPETTLYNLEQEAVLTMTGVNAHLATAAGEDIHGTGVIPNHDSDYVYYLISNNPGVELPSTGGPGTNMLYLLGIVLTGIAGAGLVMRKRRRDAA